MLEIKVPKEIELEQDLFLVMLFDKLLENSRLTEKDVEEIDRKLKKGMMETLGWK